VAAMIPYGGREALHDRKPCRERNWNQLLPAERAQILEAALRYPERSSREISCQIADTGGFMVSESTVYRLLKLAAWIKPKNTRRFPAGSEYRVKTKCPNQMWQPAAEALRRAIRLPSCHIAEVLLDQQLNRGDIQ
jgi:hypothetical protein